MESGTLRRGDGEQEEREGWENIIFFSFTRARESGKKRTRSIEFKFFEWDVAQTDQD